MPITREQLLSITPKVEGEFFRKLHGPDVCPGCREELPLTNPATGKKEMPPSSLWLLEDEQIPCKWLVINGWICGNMVYGTIVLRGPDASKNEREPQQIVNHGNSYIMNLSGRKVTDY